MTDEIDVEESQPVDVPEAQPAPPVREWSDEDAEEAKALGWKAPDEWAGNKPAGYIDDPRRYLERAESFRPFKALKERQDKLQSEFDERIRKSEAMAERALQAERARYERDLAALNARQREAVSMADTAAYDAIERQKAAMRPPEPVETPKPAGPSPDVAAYVSSNEWAQDPALLAEGAQAIEYARMSGRVFASDMDQVKYAESVMRRKYPHLFAAPATQTAAPTASRVDGGGLGGASRGSAFTSLPPEAKGAFKKFVAQGIFADTEADRKRYADDYNAA